MHVGLIAADIYKGRLYHRACTYIGAQCFGGETKHFDPVRRLTKLYIKDAVPLKNDPHRGILIMKSVKKFVNEMVSYIFE